MLKRGLQRSILAIAHAVPVGTSRYSKNEGGDRSPPVVLDRISRNRCVRQLALRPPLPLLCCALVLALVVLPPLCCDEPLLIWLCI